MAERPDLVLRYGTAYGGSGSRPLTANVAITGDRIAAVGDLSGVRSTKELDVSGLAVAPGFINMLSWAMEGLIEDGRSPRRAEGGRDRPEPLAPKGRG
ncbi:MAG: hypothetical protein FJ314_09210 [SAR202 cluster bacterium]|nr:hypothetical protein [SAR202 cluster bacterium]